MPKAVRCVRQFFDDAKPIAVIGHGPPTLIEAGIVRASPSRRIDP
jgi:putative intracellular protease/amidase